jgi:hypothetical protein
VALSAARMKEWMGADLSGLDIMVVQIDGIQEALAVDDSIRIQAVLTIGEVQQSIGDGIVSQLGDKEDNEVFASPEARGAASRLPARGRTYIP